MNQLKTKNFETQPENIFFIIILLFGIISIFVSFPLSNGDEGYHLSKSYSFFSKNHPSSMDNSYVRDMEYVAIDIGGKMETFSLHNFYFQKLEDVKADKVGLRLIWESNSILKLDIAHITPALGVLLGRFIYPSYGVMLFFGRLFNMLFFSISMFFIIKMSTVGKWSLIMLFSVPFLQKLASPSYDVFSHVAMAFFAVNVLELAKKKSFNEINKKEKSLLLLSMITLLFAKNNYIFASCSLLFVPVVTKPIILFFRNLEKKKKISISILTVVLLISSLYFLNNFLDLQNFSKVFVQNYFNVAINGRKGRSLFTVVPSVLPELFNIIWFLAVFFVMLGEMPFLWNPNFVFGSIFTFFINWIGIFAGFYLILNKPTQPFDELHGRYLQPFLIFFLPFCQRLGYQSNIAVSEKRIRLISISTTVLIMLAYLAVIFYRGFILKVTPTWN